MRESVKHPHLRNILIVGAGALIFGLGGYAIASLANQEPKQTVVATTPTPKPSATVTPTPDPNATKDWKTYTNTQYGFSFKYPTNWILDGDTSETDNLINTLTSPETQEDYADLESSGRICKGCASDIEIYYFDSVSQIPDNEKKISVLNAYIAQSEILKKIGETTIGGLKAIQVEASGFASYYIIYIEKSGHVYEIFFNHDETLEDLSATENLILSSISFTL